MDLPNYKKIAAGIKKREIKVEENEVEAGLKWLQKSRAKMSQVLRPCQKGDFVEIAFSSPQVAASQAQKDAFILGEGRLIPGFEKNLEGMAPGQEKEFSLTFPQEHFQKDLARKQAKFKVKMRAVQKVELPEINDQFAKGLGRFEGLQNLKDNIADGISKEKEIAEHMRIRQEILEKITKETDLKIPEILKEREKEQMLQGLKQRVEQQFHLAFAEYLKRIKKSEQELKESFTEPAKKRAKGLLILREIAKIEGIEVGEQEIEREVQKLLRNYPSQEKAEKEVDLASLKEYIKEAIINEKTLAKLESFAR